MDAYGSQWVGALPILKVLNSNALRESPAPSPLKIMGSARWPFRTIWLSMHYKEGPCRPHSPLLHVDIERRLEVPGETRGHP